MEVKFNINLTKKQREAYELLHRDDCKFLIARWSRQCGKTVFAEICLIEQLCKPYRFNAYISPTFAQGKKVFSEIVALLQGTKLLKKANASDLRIESVYGSTLKFFSMESATAIRGNTIDGMLVLDEAAFFPNQLSSGEDPYYNVIFPILKAKRPKVLVISTPNGKQGLFYELYLRALQGEKGFYELSATIYDDELMDKGEIENLKKNYPPLAWKQEFEVEFLDSALTVFPNFTNCFDIDSYTKGKCWCGLDPSTVGQDNTILSFINTNNEVIQYKIEGELDSKYSQIAELINQYRPVATYAESNSIGEVMANEIKKKLNKKANFYTYATTNATKKEYISNLAVRIANNDIHFERENKLLYSELATFTYKLTKNGTVTYAAKEGFHDDTVISVGLALQCKNDFKSVRNTPIFVGQTPNLVS